MENSILKKKLMRASAQKKAASQKQAILSAIPDMIFMMDSDGNYLDFKGGNGVVFIDASRIVGSNIKDSSMPPTLIAQILEHNKKAIETNQVQQLDYSIIFPDGKTRYYESRSVRYDATQTLRIVRENTESVNTANALVKAHAALKEQHEQLFKYSFMVSHKLRAPICTLLGIGNLLELEIVAANEEKKLLKDIKNQALKLDEIVHALNEVLNIDYKASSLI